MYIPKPFIPLRIHTDNLCHTAEVLGRSYTFGADGMISSVVADGTELLAEPMRIVMQEDGEEATFDDNYPGNESESFIMSRNDEAAVICGCKQSERFIIDFCNTVEYDGNISIDMKLMLRGHTVAQVFGTDNSKILRYRLDKLWLEIPLKKEFSTLFHMYPNSPMTYADGSVREESSMGMSGILPTKDASMPFKALLWLGDENKGFGWWADNEKNWQPEDENKAMEIVHTDNSVILRIRLLDGQPKSWAEDAPNPIYNYYPISFNFGFQATPVKIFPKNPYIHNAFHIDCGIKIKGNYADFFADENRFDRLKEKGVTTLILHEKWNKCQNWYELSEYTAEQLRYICDECHKRGIKVIPYFGYEISSMSPEWTNLKDTHTVHTEPNKLDGGWWRVPFQRDYIACYNSDYADLFIEGIGRLMDEFNIDGVYLDGTAYPRYCNSTEHGCGWYNHKGELKGSYNITAIKKMFKRLYNVVKSRGGHINVHSFACINYAALPYIDQTWYGENLQFELMHGTSADVNLDYFRAEYIGRNMGVPVEFIAYENRPLWTFEQAFACSVLHGILPRPNDIEYPLDFMSNIWKIFDRFPIDKSEWMPYWNNRATTNHKKVKVSYYRYTDLSGDVQLLAFAVNISAKEVRKVTVNFAENVTKATDMTNGEDVGFIFDMKPYGYKILFVR